MFWRRGVKLGFLRVFWRCGCAGDGERAEPGSHGAVGGGPGPAMAAAAAGHELLRPLPRPPGPEQERVQPLLPQLRRRRRRALLLLPPRPPRPPRRPGIYIINQFNLHRNSCSKRLKIGRLLIHG